MSRNAPPSLGGALRDIQKTAAKETRSYSATFNTKPLNCKKLTHKRTTTTTKQRTLTFAPSIGFVNKLMTTMAIAVIQKRISAKYM